MHSQLRKRGSGTGDSRGNIADEEFSDSDEPQQKGKEMFEMFSWKQTIITVIVSVVVSLVVNLIMTQMIQTSGEKSIRSNTESISTSTPYRDETEIRRIQQTIALLKEEMETLKIDQGKPKHNLEDHRLTSMSGKIEQLQAKLTRGEAELTKLREDVTESKRGIGTRSDDSKDNDILEMSDVIKQLEQNVVQVTRELNEMKSFVSVDKTEEGGFFQSLKNFFVSPTEVKSMKSELDKVIESKVEAEKNQLTDQITDVKDSFESQMRSKQEIFTQETNILAGKLQNKMEEIERYTKEKVEEMERNANYFKSNLDSHRETIGEIVNVLVNKETLTIIIIVLAIGELIIIAVLYKALSAKGGGFAGSAQAETGDILWDSSKKILNKIRPQSTQNGLCIVSFHRETQAAHQILTNSLVADDNTLRRVAQLQALVYKHSEILHLPAARLYLVFVDFNERHIILEDPSKGLGDLRLTTVRAARKIGGDVVVVYVRDSGSRQLTDGHLYNPELTSVRTHRELSDLESRQRVLSIYETFSYYQIQHLKTIMISNITNR